MQRLTVRHTTVYRYARPVAFKRHWLLFRPRDSHDLRLIDSRLAISPQATIRWHHDVFGNSIATADFADVATELRLASTVVLDHFGLSYPEFTMEPYAETMPFAYASEEMPDLAQSIQRHYPDPAGDVAAWARRFLSPSGPTLTSGLVADMTRAVNHQFVYRQRDELGVQMPTETLRLGTGSCRDYALFLMEAARSLGLAARFVTGYVHDPAAESGGATLVGGGATHAWIQLYLPGAGWIDCDPTNGLVGMAHLIAVGVARDPSQAIPLKGAFVGQANDFLGMDVEVKVRAIPWPDYRELGKV